MSVTVEWGVEHHSGRDDSVLGTNPYALEFEARRRVASCNRGGATCRLVRREVQVGPWVTVTDEASE